MYFCLVDSSEIPTIQIENLDKVIHSFFHFVLTIVWFLFFKKQLQSNSILKPSLFAFFFSFCVGIAIEFIQQIFTITRHADVLDVVANCVGAGLGTLVIVIANKLNLFDRI